jgi:hypothetical protein
MRDWATFAAVAGLIGFGAACLWLRHFELAGTAIGGLAGWLSPRAAAAPPANSKP